jgi:hypothetical protein
MFGFKSAGTPYSVISFEETTRRLQCRETDLFPLFDAGLLQRAKGLLISSRNRRMVYEAGVIALEEAGFAGRGQAASENSPANPETK